MDRSEYTLQSITRYRVRPSRFKVEKARAFHSAGEAKVVYKSEGRNYGAKVGLSWARYPWKVIVISVIIPAWLRCPEVKVKQTRNQLENEQ